MGHCLSPDITRTYPIIHPDQMTQDSSDETLCLKSWEKDQKNKTDTIPLTKLMHWTFPITKNPMKSSQILSFLWPTSIQKIENLIYQLSHFSDFSGGWSTLRRNLPDEKISGWHKERGWNGLRSPLKSYHLTPIGSRMGPSFPTHFSGGAGCETSGYFYCLIWEGWCQMRCDHLLFSALPTWQ